MTLDPSTSGDASTVLLADGTSVLLRSVRPTDRDDLLALHDRASDQSLYRRFFSISRASAQTYIDRICEPGTASTSVVALRHGSAIGVASAVPGPAGSSEVALLVEESLHGVGIGSVLLEELSRRAWRAGVHTFTADVLTENVAMLRVFHDLGFDLVQQRDHEVLSLSLDLTPGVSSVLAADGRHRHAHGESVRRLFEPATVAVVGVSRSRGGVGREVLENLRAGGFGGALHAVGHPDLSVPGADCVTDVSDLPHGVDLAVVAVPPARLEATVEGLALRGAHSCVVLTAGLAETGPEGARREQRLAALARAHDMRLVGPNCFGVLSNLRGTRLDATFGTVRPRPGPLAVGSQSGGVGVALLDAAASRGLGLASFVSLGNKADVSGNDLVAAWHDDPDVRAGALYLESFHDPRTFARLAAELSLAKPLLVVFGGSSAAGVRAGASHTAAHATSARALQALYRAAGVVPVDDVVDLVDTAALLTEQPLPAGGRLGVVSNAGGLGILAADAAQRRAVDVPRLSEATRARLAAAAPHAAGTSNPVDLGAAAGASVFADAAARLAESGEVDSVLVVIAATRVTDVDAVVEAVESALAGSELPCLSVLVGAEQPAARRTTRFRSADAAVRSLAHAHGYAAWRRSAPDHVRLRAEAARSDETAATQPADGAGWLTVSAAEELLAPVVALAPYALVTSDRETREAVRRLPPPLVVKTADPTVVHKTEGGLVVPGLLTQREVLDAVRGLRRTTGDPRLPVIVQQQVTGPELAFGVTRDPVFGPLLMLSSGGTRLDLWDDQVFLMPPLDPDDVRTALRSLRTWPLLTGFRGGQALDTEAVVALVVSLGALALDRADIAELDLNPVVVTGSGPVCVDAKIRLAT